MPCGAALTWRAHSERRGRWPRRGIAITLAATLATAPLLAHHFGSVPSTGLLANLLALPAVAPAMWLGMVKAALGQAAAPAPPVGWLASALGPLADLPVAYLAALAERLGGPRSGQLSPPLGGTLAVTGAYGALAIAAAAALRAAAALGPRAEELAAAWRRRPRSHRFGVGAAALVAMVLGGVRLLGTPPPPDVLTVRFLDVGQGDATLVQHPDGAAVLFDGGPPEAGVVRLLRGAGVRRLSAVVATRASRDHHGGLRGARALSGRRAARRR